MVPLPDTMSAACVRIGAKLRECELVGGEEFGCTDLNPDECLVGCYQAAPCETLQEALCELRSNAFLGCSAFCAAQDFVCEDGEKVPRLWVCDSTSDCLNGEDEADCPGLVTYPCADGSGTINPAWKCDGFADCTDGSDEDDCEDPWFSCGEGEEPIPQEWVCDGDADCSDAEDETNCPPPLVCDGGAVSVPTGWICDGIEDCRDGADELDCGDAPGFACHDGLSVLPDDWRCDGVEDCGDGSDERECPGRLRILCDSDTAT